MLVGAGGFERRDAAQHQLGVAEQFTAQLRDQFAGADLEHPRPASSALSAGPAARRSVP